MNLLILNDIGFQLKLQHKYLTFYVASWLSGFCRWREGAYVMVLGEEGAFLLFSYCFCYIYFILHYHH